MRSVLSWLGSAALLVASACSAAPTDPSADEGTPIAAAGKAAGGARRSGGPVPLATTTDGGACGTTMRIASPGLVIPSAVVSQAYWGGYWSSGAGATERTGYDTAWKDIASNPAFYQRLAEYSTSTQTITTGSWGGSSLGDPALASGATIGEDQIQAELAAEITAGTLPPRSDSRLYVVMLPPGVTSTFDQSNGFAGHHRSFADASGKPIYYAVITYNSDPNYNDPLISHEISEAITDPDLVNGWISTTGDEIGDICRFNYATLDGYEIEKIFSQQQCACVGAGSSGPPPVITNGDFEQPTLAGWTATGTASVASPGHSGLQSALLGARSATNGDSTIAQTFTAPSSGGTLSFWYKVQCPDTVQYDWATATLADVTAGTTTTPLPKTCTNTGAWSKVTASLVAGHQYTLTLVSHDDNYAGDPTDTFFDDVVVDASSPPPSGIVNGGFETGDLTGWTPAASAAISASAHSGSDAVLLGLLNKPTNGDSSVTQTFTAPAAVTSLSFWYQVVCKDTVQYDWATASLKDNTAGTTTTPLAKTCSNTGAWAQVTVPVTAGHGYTLKLVSHDDNYAGDETYTWFDDVALQ
jgi:hypothetical protein